MTKRVELVTASNNNQKRVTLYNSSQSENDRNARGYIGVYYRRHIHTGRKDFLAFISKTKQPLTKYEAFIILLDERLVYARSLKAIYGILTRSGNYSPIIIRLWKNEHGINFSCSPGCYIYDGYVGQTNNPYTYITQEIKEAGIAYMKTKLKMV